MGDYVLVANWTANIFEFRKDREMAVQDSKLKDFVAFLRKIYRGYLNLYNGGILSVSDKT